MNVPLFPVLPIREHSLGESDHGLPVPDHSLTMESRLSHAALTPPIFSFAGNQSVAEQLVQDTVVLVAFDEQAVGAAEHMLDIFRTGDHDRIPILLDAQPEHFTVLVGALRQKAKKIKAYIEQIAEEGKPSWAWRKRQLRHGPLIPFHSNDGVAWFSNVRPIFRSFPLFLSPRFCQQLLQLGDELHLELDLIVHVPESQRYVFRHFNRIGLRSLPVLQLGP